MSYDEDPASDRSPSGTGVVYAIILELAIYVVLFALYFVFRTHH